jgi:2-polyprenyl-3-methyl-5-hydroxy-6-metoxy-1,4-benzoquinol methylase
LSRCPVCRSERTRHLTEAWDSEYHTSEDRFNYRACSDCEVLFIDPMPLDRLTEIYPANYYSAGAGDEGSLLAKLKLYLDGRIFKNILEDVPGSEIRVLDIGGGNGWILDAIRRLEPRVSETHEVDLDENMRFVAERSGHIFHRARVEDFEPPCRFDLVVMLNLIEHVADPGLVLRNVSNWLTPGGRVLIKTPNVDTLDRRLFQSRNWGGFHCPRHWVLFTRPSLIDLAGRSGLDCEWARYTQGAPQWTNSILGWLADRGMIHLGRNRPMHTHPLHMPLMALCAAFDILRAPFVPTAQMFVLLRKSAPNEPG